MVISPMNNSQLAFRRHQNDPAEHLARVYLLVCQHRLRPDFVLDDLIIVLMANDGIHAVSPAARVACDISSLYACDLVR